MKPDLKDWKERIIVDCWAMNEMTFRPKKWARKKTLPCAYLFHGKVIVSPKTYDRIMKNDPSIKEMYFINYESTALEGPSEYVAEATKGCGE